MEKEDFKKWKKEGREEREMRQGMKNLHSK